MALRLWRRVGAGARGPALARRLRAIGRDCGSAASTRTEAFSIEGGNHGCHDTGDPARGTAAVRTPLFTLTAALTLALAIGANASIFTVVQRVVLNPLPYPDSDRLIALDYGIPARNMPPA